MFTAIWSPDGIIAAQVKYRLFVFLFPQRGRQEDTMRDPFREVSDAETTSSYQPQWPESTAGTSAEEQLGRL